MLGTAEPYIGPGAYGGNDQPKLTVFVERKDNGYVLKLIEPPVFPEPDVKTYDAKEIDTDHDKQIDAMIDGLMAFTKSLNDKVTGGEEWKGDENRIKIREGFKLMFGMGRRGMPIKPFPEARIENMVFPAKEELLAYLAKNL